MMNISKHIRTENIDNMNIVLQKKRGGRMTTLSSIHACSFNQSPKFSSWTKDISRIAPLTSSTRHLSSSSMLFPISKVGQVWHCNKYENLNFKVNMNQPISQTDLMNYWCKGITTSLALLNKKTSDIKLNKQIVVNLGKRYYLDIYGHEVQVGMYALLYAHFPMYKKYITFRPKNIRNLQHSK